MNFHAMLQPKSAASNEGNATIPGFGMSYEHVEAELSKISRLHIELDGSFVWVSATDVSHKVNGQITDDGKQVMYIEFRGIATAAEIEPILAPLKSDRHELTFQMLPGGEILNESQFKEFLDG